MDKNIFTYVTMTQENVQDFFRFILFDRQLPQWICHDAELAINVSLDENHFKNVDSGKILNVNIHRINQDTGKTNPNAIANFRGRIISIDGAMALADKIYQAVEDIKCTDDWVRTKLQASRAKLVDITQIPSDYGNW